MGAILHQSLMVDMVMDCKNALQAENIGGFSKRSISARFLDDWRSRKNQISLRLKWAK